MRTINDNFTRGGLTILMPPTVVLSKVRDIRSKYC